MKELAQMFFKLGGLGFGGPLATISLMEDEIVQKRQWVTREKFSESYSLLKLFPGPIATQMAVRLGWLKAGISGGVVAGILFIIPSFLMILVLGIFLNALNAGKSKDIFVLGMQVSALAVVLQGAWRLGQANIKGARGYIIGFLAFLIVFFRPGLEPIVILSFGLVGVFSFFAKRSGRTFFELSSIIIIVLICFKAALLSFGTGLAIIPLLQGDVVERFHLLNNSEFLEAMALGQITPGPVVITVTWIGFKVAGFLGAMIATVAVFLPGFFVSLFFLPWFEKKWGNHGALKTFYTFAVPAVVGGMFAVATRLLKVSLSDPITWGVFIGSAVLVFWRKTQPWIVIPLFGLIALLLTRVMPVVTLHLPL